MTPCDTKIILTINFKNRHWFAIIADMQAGTFYVLDSHPTLCDNDEGRLLIRKAANGQVEEDASRRTY